MYPPWALFAELKREILHLPFKRTQIRIVCNLNCSLIDMYETNTMRVPKNLQKKLILPILQKLPMCVLQSINKNKIKNMQILSIEYSYIFSIESLAN